MRANFDWLSMWKKIKDRRELILKGSLAAAIVLVLVLDVWLGTCGFERCPARQRLTRPEPGVGWLSMFRLPVAGYFGRGGR